MEGRGMHIIGCLRMTDLMHEEEERRDGETEKNRII